MVESGMPFENGEWAPVRSGDYATDTAEGRRLGEALHLRMQQTQNPALFGSVMRGISEAGTFQGVEIGLCSFFGVKLLGL